MQVKVIFVLVISIVIPSSVYSFPNKNTEGLNISTNINLNSSPSNHESIISKIADLSSNQPENIRQIISANQKKQPQRIAELGDAKSQGRKLDYATYEEEKFPTLEELREKCQHFSRLFGLTQTRNPSVDRLSNSETESSNRPIEITRRPVYIRNKPTFIQKNNNGFYVTASAITENEASTTRKPFWISSSTAPSSTHSSQLFDRKYTTTSTTTRSTSTTSSPIENSDSVTNNSNIGSTERSKIKIRYTKFEPVILQKTILTDGRVLYHWHKSLPTTALDLPAPITPVAAPIIPTYEYPTDIVPLGTRNFPIVEPITEPTTTSTSTEKSSWLYVPFSGLFGGSNEEENVETTTVKLSTTSSTTAGPVSVKSSTTPRSDFTSDGTKLQQQIKFVVPVHYDDIDASINSQNKPWDYSRFGFAPKGIAQANPVLSQPYQMRSVEISQNVPRYSLGYAAPGYGLTFNNGLSYSTYGAGYGNYQRSVRMEKENKRLDDVSL